MSSRLTKDQISAVLESHAQWLKDGQGERANLADADLTDADLTDADLTRANLTRANLTKAKLTGAKLTDADLTGADLTNADLTKACLTDANLWSCTGNMLQIKSMQIGRYLITYTADRLQIGCKNHKIDEWWEFSDDTISRMDKGALGWWRRFKEPLRAIIAASPATPTGHKPEGAVQ